MTFSYICLATFASTAEIGSSSRYMSAFAYKALAKANLAFWPPDKVVPFYPSIVPSPFSNKAKSFFKHDLYMTS